MITITHYKSGSVGVHCRPGEALYALGLKPANHLPPAIPMEVEWYPDPLIIIQSRGQQMKGCAPDDPYASERCWYTTWRSDGLKYMYTDNGYII